jgi:hypothetical protein
LNSSGDSGSPVYLGDGWHFLLEASLCNANNIISFYDVHHMVIYYFCKHLVEDQ